MIQIRDDVLGAMEVGIDLLSEDFTRYRVSPRALLILLSRFLAYDFIKNSTEGQSSQPEVATYTPSKPAISTQEVRRKQQR